MKRRDLGPSPLARDVKSHLRDFGQQVNRKLLEVERVSHHCVLTQEALDRLQRPTVETGQGVSALRFGDPRVMALFQALSRAASVIVISAPTWKRSSVVPIPRPK